jgi:hypothetical protein
VRVLCTAPAAKCPPPVSGDTAGVSGFGMQTTLNQSPSLRRQTALCHPGRILNISGVRLNTGFGKDHLWQSKSQVIDQAVSADI